MEDINQMLGLAVENIEKGFLAFDDRNMEELERIAAREEEIDPFDARSSRRISKVLAIENSPSEVGALRRIFTIIGNVEWTGDYAIDTAEHAQIMMEHGLELISQAHVELKEIRDTTMAAMHLICNTSRLISQNLLNQTSALEEDTDNKTMFFRASQVECVGNRTYHVETSILCSKTLTDYERIGDHTLSIAQTCAELGNGAGTGPVRFTQVYSEQGKA